MILISQLIANGVHGALGKVVREAVEEVPKKEHDQNWLKLNMVGVNAVAVTQTQVYVIQTIVQVLMKHTHYTKQNFLLYM